MPDLVNFIRGTIMQLTIQVKIDDGGGNAITEDVFSLENCDDEGLVGL